ncbi:hypothetical protein EDD85DRAFT_793510 [Armillaria nabsnona]|nr:hypothetical protein EDD85DRAFT_793510 [Armillaria nabsnona]
MSSPGRRYLSAVLSPLHSLGATSGPRPNAHRLVPDVSRESEHIRISTSWRLSTYNSIQLIEPNDSASSPACLVNRILYAGAAQSQTSNLGSRGAGSQCPTLPLERSYSSVPQRLFKESSGIMMSGSNKKYKIRARAIGDDRSTTWPSVHFNLSSKPHCIPNLSQREGYIWKRYVAVQTLDTSWIAVRMVRKMDQVHSRPLPLLNFMMSKDFFPVVPTDDEVKSGKLVVLEAKAAAFSFVGPLRANLAFGQVLTMSGCPRQRPFHPGPYIHAMPDTNISCHPSFVTRLTRTIEFFCSSIASHGTFSTWT